MLISLEGRNYTGFFSGEEKNRSYRHTGESQDRNDYWWEGTGNIVKRTGEQIRFSFKSSFGRPSYLNNAIINFSSSRVSFQERPKIKDNYAVIDLVLEQMYNEFMSRLGKKDFSNPYIVPPALNLEELTARGLIEA